MKLISDIAAMKPLISPWVRTKRFLRGSTATTTPMPSKRRAVPGGGASRAKALSRCMVDVGESKPKTLHELVHLAVVW